MTPKGHYALCNTNDASFGAHHENVNTISGKNVAHRFYFQAV